MRFNHYTKRTGSFTLLLLLGFLSILPSCAIINPFFPSSGPSKSQIVDQDTDKNGVIVIDVNDAVVRKILAVQKHVTFSEEFPDTLKPNFVVGPGDTLEVTLWEAQPATLFGTHDPRTGVATNQATSFPEQMVMIDGTIRVPFAGIIKAAGKSPTQIEEQIVKNLAGLAHQPQVMVRVTHNTTSNVTVVGEVMQNARMPLTPKGERLLDTLAATGGVKQPVDKMTIQITRGGQVKAMPLDEIIRDPNQNILLHAGDIVTALHQPFSFTALGATGKNQEINFETRGITLAQALGRIGGIDDLRANAEGIFIFRFEDPNAVDAGENKLALTPEGKAPVVYRVDLKDPATFLTAQNFPLRNKDVIYVANAPAAEFQKFMNIIYTSVFSAVALKTLDNTN